MEEGHGGISRRSRGFRGCRVFARHAGRLDCEDERLRGYLRGDRCAARVEVLLLLLLHAGELFWWGGGKSNCGIDDGGSNDRAGRRDGSSSYTSRTSEQTTRYIPCWARRRMLAAAGDDDDANSPDRSVGFSNFEALQQTLCFCRQTHRSTSRASASLAMRAVSNEKTRRADDRGFSLRLEHDGIWLPIRQKEPPPRAHTLSGAIPRSDFLTDLTG